jgi:hypothetical protein
METPSAYEIMCALYPVVAGVLLRLREDLHTMKIGLGLFLGLGRRDFWMARRQSSA